MALSLFPQASRALSPSSTQSYQRFSVAQESQIGLGDFDDNVLGFIDAIQTTQTTAEYYAYHQGYVASFNGGFDLFPDTSHLFLVDAADGLSLFTVHDSPEDGSGGKTLMRVHILGDDADILVLDDPPEKDLAAPDNNFLIQHFWAGCCTDGFAVGSLDNDWQAFLKFAQKPTGISNWQAFSGSDDEPIDLDLVPHRWVRLEQVPEPSVILGLLTLGATGALIKRRATS